jgi:hypothetical protein
MLCLPERFVVMRVAIIGTGATAIMRGLQLR